MNTKPNYTFRFCHADGGGKSRATYICPSCRQSPGNHASVCIGDVRVEHPKPGTYPHSCRSCGAPMPLVINACGRVESNFP